MEERDYASPAAASRIHEETGRTQETRNLISVAELTGVGGLPESPPVEA